MEDQFLTNVKEALEIEDREISLDDEFRSYEEWTSIAFLSLIAMIDEEYDVILTGNKFKTMETLRDVLEAIKAAKS